MLKIFNKKGILLDCPLYLSIESDIFGQSFRLMQDKLGSTGIIADTLSALENELTRHNGKVIFIRPVEPRYGFTVLDSISGQAIRQKTEEVKELLPRIGYTFHSDRKGGYVYVKDI